MKAISSERGRERVWEREGGKKGKIQLCESKLSISVLLSVQFGGGDGADDFFSFLLAVWACPCLRPLVFLPQAPCEGNGVCCEGKPWPACQEAAHRMKWAQTKQGRGRPGRGGGGGVPDNSGGGILPHLYHSYTFVPPPNSCVIWVRVTGYTTYIHDRTHIHFADWERSGVVGGKDGMWNLPSCSANLCFGGRWKSHYVTCLTWPWRTPKLIC